MEYDYIQLYLSPFQMNTYAPMAAPSAGGLTGAPSYATGLGSAGGFGNSVGSYGVSPVIQAPLIVNDGSQEESDPNRAMILGFPIFAVMPALVFAACVAAVVAVVVAAIIAAVIAVVAKGGLLDRLLRNRNRTPQQYSEETTPYYNYSEPESYIQQKRRKRASDKGSSSGLPAVSLAQVDKMTEIVFAAMRSQECIQRLLCEVGTLSKSYSNTTHSVAVVVKQFIPESMNKSFSVFIKAEKCQQYKCGSLQVEK